MQLTPLISIALPLLGVLVGSAITYWGAVRLARLNARQEAGRRLREAFYPELAALDPAVGSKNGTDVESILRKAWPRHRAAVSELMIHLAPQKRQDLSKAWRQYYEVGGSIRFYDYHMTASPTDDPRKKFEERVQAILRFTEE